MKLLLLRHGDAVSAAADDASRPLSPLGREQSRRAGKFLAQTGMNVDLLLCSPLQRAEETAGGVADFLSAKKTTTEHLVPSSDPGNLIKELNRTSGRVILCIGHEPHLSSLISLLLTGNRDVHVTMGKGDLACVDVSLPAAPGRGSLCWLVTNELLNPAGRLSGAP